MQEGDAVKVCAPENNWSDLFVCSSKAVQKQLDSTNSDLDKKQDLRIANLGNGDISHRATFGFFYDNGIYTNLYIDGTVYGQIPPIGSIMQYENIRTIFNKHEPPVLNEFHLSSDDFLKLHPFYYYTPHSNNGRGGYGIAIPMGTTNWHFWIAIGTEGKIYIKTQINDYGWSAWALVGPQ